MSSNGSMPGSGTRVVYGNGPISAREPVRIACRLDFPEFGGPMRPICAAPSRCTECTEPPRAGPLRGSSNSSPSCLIRDLMSAWMCSVPLCLGMVRSISFRQSRRSPGSRAARKACSALLYSGERLAGIAQRAYNNPRTL